MTASPVSPIRQRANHPLRKALGHPLRKALGAELTRLYSAVLTEPPPESFLRLLGEADQLVLLKAPKLQPSTTPRSKLTLFG